MKRTLIALSLIASCCASAQMCMTTPPKEANVYAFPSGTMFDGVGTSDMPVTTQNEKVKALVRQGYAMIHCFWFDEAIRSMRDATKLDPTCAGAWLGLNIALIQPWAYSPEFRDEAEFAIGRAVMASASSSPVEQAMIAAFRSRKIPANGNDPVFETAMKGVLDAHPGFDEPRLVWAGMRTQICMGVGYSVDGSVRGDLDFVAKLIAPVLKKNPKNHAAMHYDIHATEPATPKAAERSADWIGKIAFRSSHMVHMAGHTFNRIGRYEDAHKAFSRARQIEEEDAVSLKTTPYNANWNYGHNLAFMAMNLAEMGRTDEALEVAKKAVWSEMGIRWRTGNWQMMAEWATKAYPRNPKHTDFLFFTGIKAATEGDWLTANTRYRTFEEVYTGRTKGKAEDKFGTDERIDATMLHELLGALRFMEGRFEEGRAAFEKSIVWYHKLEYGEPVIYARPPYQSYGDALVKEGFYSQAISVYRRGILDRPNSPWYLKSIDAAIQKSRR